MHFMQAVGTDTYAQGVMMITVLDIIGTFAFAITGCFKAIKHELDILGLVILGLMTGIGGGIVRDVILGVQPAALSTNMYFFIFRRQLFQEYPTLLMFVTIGIIVAARLVALKMNFRLKKL